MKKKFTIEKKLIAQVRFYEELYMIKDDRGETIFAGTEVMAKKFVAILNKEALGRKKRK